MSGAAWAWAGYLLWLLAGCADFRCHRRSDLPHTSGLAESLLHVLQMGLMGTLVLAWLAARPFLPLLALSALLVLAHALAGYADTRTAWGRRPVTPLEQHIHSVLDAAPWAALGIAAYGQGAAALARGWTWEWRAPLPPAWVWIAVLLPALLLCMVPLLAELAAAWRARARRAGG